MITDNTSHVLETDAEGYLIDPAEWDEAAAEQLAQGEGIVLTEQHWQVIRFMRSYFDEHQVAADVRHVIKHLDNDLGYGKQGRDLIFKLFPYGYVKQACKIAGMKRPRGWSTG